MSKLCIEIPFIRFKTDSPKFPETQSSLNARVALCSLGAVMLIASLALCLQGLPSIGYPFLGSGMGLLIIGSVCKSRRTYEELKSQGNSSKQAPPPNQNSTSDNALREHRQKVFVETMRIITDNPKWNGEKKFTVDAQVEYRSPSGKKCMIDNNQALNEGFVYETADSLPQASKSNSTKFHTENQDTFDLLVRLHSEGKNNLVGINMANAIRPGGGVMNGAMAQEEELCRRSNLYVGLLSAKEKFNIATIPQNDSSDATLGTVLCQKGKYLPDKGGIYVPGVKIFRKGPTQNNPESYGFMDEPVTAAIIGVAAFNLTSGSDLKSLGIAKNKDITSELLNSNVTYLKCTKEKIRNMLRIVASQGHTTLVLGALGCGAFGNPPEIVSRIFKEVFQEQEFKGHFSDVYFAVLQQGTKGINNFNAFHTMCEELNADRKGPESLSIMLEEH